MKLIKNSSGSTFNRGDFTDGNAFLWSSIDLSPYKGMDKGNTPYYIELLDAAGKKATGYIAAVGAGETLGSELFENPGFDADTDWNSSPALVWIISGGTANSTGVNGYLYQAVSLPMGSLVLMVVNVATIIGGNVIIIPSTGAFPPYGGPYTTTGIKSKYMTTIDNSIYSGAYGGLFSGSIDDLSMKLVTDPPPTAVHIVSSLNGTTRNWASIESGFDPNNIASWNIYNLGNAAKFIILARRRGRR